MIGLQYAEQERSAVGGVNVDLMHPPKPESASFTPVAVRKTSHYRLIDKWRGFKMKINSVLAVSGLVLAIGASFASADAQAVTSPRQFYSNPAGLCQGALPAFETAIRKRPLAIANEGSSNAFVTCAFTSQGDFSGSINNPTTVAVFFNTFSGAATVINCTGVTGYQQGPNQFVVKTATAPASGGQTSMTWNAADFTGAPANFPSGAFGISCDLPPGAAINDSVVFFSEEIGI